MPLVAELEPNPDEPSRFSVEDFRTLEPFQQDVLRMLHANSKDYMPRVELLHHNEGNPYYVDKEDSRHLLLEELVMNALVEERKPREDLASLIYLTRDDVRRAIDEDYFLGDLEENITPGEPDDDDFGFTDYSGGYQYI